MNTIARTSAAALLVAVMPMAAAQSSPQNPQDSPPAEQVQEDPAKDTQEGVGIRKEIDQTVDAIRSYSAERRTEAMANAKRGIEDLDRQMQLLQERMDQRRGRMSQSARSRSEATMADLRERRNTLAEWYGGLRHSSTAAWGEVRAGFVKSYHDLADAMRKANEVFEQDRQDKQDSAADQPASDDRP